MRFPKRLRNSRSLREGNTGGKPRLDRTPREEESLRPLAYTNDPFDNEKRREAFETYGFEKGLEMLAGGQP